MSNDERIAFLSEHPINSRWDRLPNGGSKWWTVHSFFAIGRGETFSQALDDCIRVYGENVARHEAACAGPAERRGARP